MDCMDGWMRTSSLIIEMCPTRLVSFECDDCLWPYSHKQFIFQRISILSLLNYETICFNRCDQYFWCEVRTDSHGRCLLENLSG